MRIILIKLIIHLRLSIKKLVIVHFNDGGVHRC